MPGMSGSGNMIPQSRMTIRPSTSMQAQLRPISPSPPRKTTRTGFGLPRSAKRGDRDRGSADGGEDLGRLGVELGGGRAHREAALADLEAQRAHGGCGRQRVRVVGGGLEVEGVEQLRVAGDRSVK